MLLSINRAADRVLLRDEKKTASSSFKDDLVVPKRDRQKYDEYLKKYLDLDLYSNLGEEETVRWILQRESNFFEHTLPFIGYIQFLLEGPELGPWRIKRFEAQMGWTLADSDLQIMI